MLDSHEVYARLARVLVQGMGVEGVESYRQQRFRETSAQSSIDFLDIVFRLEKEFAIKIPRRGVVLRAGVPG